MAVTNAQASREVPASQYTITADLDPRNTISETDSIQGKQLQTSISIDINDTTGISAGDYIDIKFDQWMLKSGDVYNSDGVVVGKLEQLTYDYNGYHSTTLVSPGAELDMATVNRITADKPGLKDFVFRLTLNDVIEGMDSMSIRYESDMYNLVASIDHEEKITSTISTSDGRVLDTVKSTLPATILPNPKNTTTYVYTSAVTYDFNSDIIIRDGRIGSMELEEEQALMKAGTILTWDFSDNLGTVYKLNQNYSGPINGFAGNQKNADGVYYTGGTPVKFEVVSFENNVATVRILEDAKLAVGQVLIQVTGTVPAIDESTIDSVTGYFLDNSVPMITTMTPPGGETRTWSSDYPYVYRGIWTEGEGSFSPKYTSTLNAVLEDGTVIKQ